MSESGDVTTLLGQWRSGDASALERLIPIVYDELRANAARLMRHEQPSHTLEATALVHEAYVKLVGAEVDWQNRSHFFSVAARQMRRILADHAKAKHRDKRGGELQQVSLEAAAVAEVATGVDFTDVDEALARLAVEDARKVGVIELHFFAGLTIDEMAMALGTSAATVNRDLKFAKAWLYRELRPA